MGETSNFYEKCSSLSKKGDEKSLRTLLQMGISGNKTARVALRKTMACIFLMSRKLHYPHRDSLHC